MDTRGMYASVAYLLSRRFELGSYYSRSLGGWGTEAGNNAQLNRVWDKVMTVRVHLKRYWYLKVEGCEPAGLYGHDQTARRAHRV
jgi:hypothetical protein